MAVVEAGFEAPDAKVSLCTLTLKLPKFKFGFNLPPFHFPPPIPLPFFGFALNCNPDDPIDVSAGLAWGGGRASRALPEDSTDD